ncbi:MAG: hypothetical protein ABSB59_25615 [Streptosporangiaceae bacterium]
MTGLVMDAATKFVGRAISRRLKRAFDERVVPAMAARQEQMASRQEGVARQEGILREQIAIAERYPDLRACLSDQVVFLAGGSRVVSVPMANLTSGFSLAQADAVVAQLRNG